LGPSTLNIYSFQIIQKSLSQSKYIKINPNFENEFLGYTYTVHWTSFPIPGLGPYSHVRRRSSRTSTPKTPSQLASCLELRLWFLGSSYNVFAGRNILNLR
jgi:hypothetical protein